MKKLILSILCATGFFCANAQQDTLSIPVAGSPKIKHEFKQRQQNDLLDSAQLRQAYIKNMVLERNCHLSMRPLLSVFKEEELKDKAIVLVFWSADCGSCTDNFSAVSSILKQFKYSKDLVVVALTKDHNRVVSEKLKENPLLYADVVSSAGAIINAYRPDQLPSYVVADKSHKVIFAASGSSEVVLPGFRNAIGDVLKTN